MDKQDKRLDGTILRMAGNIAAAGYAYNLECVHGAGYLSDNRREAIASDALAIAREILKQAGVSHV